MAKNTKEIFESHYRMQVINALRSATQAVLNRYLPEQVESGIDIGCGDGFFYRHLAPDELKPKITGVDNHPPSIYAFKQAVPEASVLMNQATNLTLNSNSQDIIIGFSSYPLLYQEGVIGELKRVLKPKGVLLAFHDSGISDHFQDKDAYDKIKRVESYHRLLQQRLKRQQFDLISGDDPVEAAVLSTHSSVWERIPTDMQAKIPLGNVVVGTYSELGVNRIYHDQPDKATDKFNKMITDIGSPSVLEGFNPHFGEQVLEFVRMRYIVAQKKIKTLLLV